MHAEEHRAMSLSLESHLQYHHNLQPEMILPCITYIHHTTQDLNIYRRLSKNIWNIREPDKSIFDCLWWMHFEVFPIARCEKLIVCILLDYLHLLLFDILISARVDKIIQSSGHAITWKARKIRWIPLRDAMSSS